MVLFSIPPTLAVLDQRTRVVCLATLLISVQLPQELTVSQVSKCVNATSVSVRVSLKPSPLAPNYFRRNFATLKNQERACVVIRVS